LTTLRERRIAELRDYARDHWNDIIQKADEEIREEGYVRVYDKRLYPSKFMAPSLERRDTFYVRPYGDFLLLLMKLAEERYYVTEGTSKSYASAALAPFSKELDNWQYRRVEDVRGRRGGSE
jgi:hypothetical protein